MTFADLIEESNKVKVIFLTANKVLIQHVVHSCIIFLTLQIMKSNTLSVSVCHTCRSVISLYLFSSIGHGISLRGNLYWSHIRPTCVCAYV